MQAPCLVPHVLLPPCCPRCTAILHCNTAPQLSKSEREAKGLRLKLKQAAAKLEKAQGLGSKLQELGVGLVADAQPVE